MNSMLTTEKATALELDQQDPLRKYRQKFRFPLHQEHEHKTYFCGNSLGLQPVDAAARVQSELDAWGDFAVDGHFVGDQPWLKSHEKLRDGFADLLGAKTAEVTAMNALTVNLHLLMASFFQPRGQRNRILIERQPFPSDRYAVESQLRWHGLDPEECLIEFGGESEQRLLNEDDLAAYLAEHGDRVALVLWPGVHYATGQKFNLRRISEAAHSAGAKVGFDLAHAVGNVSVNLHDSGADFAAWCTYKYLNSGPGAIAGAFVHERHHGSADLPRLHGWWGVDPKRRFEMGPVFHPAQGVDAWLLSNSPILSSAPLRVSLEMFSEVGMAALLKKSGKLTGYLESLLHTHLGDTIEIITPADPEQRGCQLSMRIKGGRDEGRSLFEHLQAEGIITDWREPDIIRAAPVPLYNSFEDCWILVNAMSAWRDLR